tara:strand:- start:2270 stop:2764 length:495 start_codon:yes stop_codon:yes gene_type:complete
MSHLYKYWGIEVFILSILAIFSALIAEHLFNLVPCEMCLHQRYPYYFIIAIFLIFYFIKKTSNILLYLLIELSVFYGLFYSIWHVAVEQKILQGPQGCSGRIEKASSTDILKEQILNQSIMDCSNITWEIFGMSAAIINTILLLIIVFFNTIFIIRMYYKNEKK